MGNKLDRSNERELDLKIAMEKAKQLDVEYIETSAKTNTRFNPRYRKYY